MNVYLPNGGARIKPEICDIAEPFIFEHFSCSFWFSLHFPECVNCMLEGDHVFTRREEKEKLSWFQELETTFVINITVFFIVFCFFLF